MGRLASVAASGLTPRASVAIECARRGRWAVVEGCIDLLEGRGVDDALIEALGVGAARYVLDGNEGARDGYWPRVWAARGLLHAWDDAATPAVVRALADPAWRVREMAAKVVARHCVADAVEAVAALGSDPGGDPVPRVRAASRRALAVLTAAGA